MEAIQTSWDHEGMIAQEYGGFESVLEHFALHQDDFALPPLGSEKFLSAA